MGVHLSRGRKQAKLLADLILVVLAFIVVVGLLALAVALYS